MDEGERKDVVNEALLTLLLSQKVASGFFVEFLQKLQTHVGHTRTATIVLLIILFSSY